MVCKKKYYIFSYNSALFSQCSIVTLTTWFKYLLWGPVLWELHKNPWIFNYMLLNIVVTCFIWYIFYIIQYMVLISPSLKSLIMVCFNYMQISADLYLQLNVKRIITSLKVYSGFLSLCIWINGFLIAYKFFFKYFVIDFLHTHVLFKL